MSKHTITLESPIFQDISTKRQPIYVIEEGKVVSLETVIQRKIGNILPKIFRKFWADRYLEWGSRTNAKTNKWAIKNLGGNPDVDTAEEALDKLDYIYNRGIKPSEVEKTIKEAKITITIEF